MNYGKAGVLALSVALLATSCKKDTEAFPTVTPAGGYTADFAYETPTLPSIKDADAILAAVHVHNYRIVTISPVEKEFQYGLAAFTNTTGNFSSLTSGGALVVDTSSLTANSAGLYQSYPTTYSLNFGSTVYWSVGGAGSFPAATNTITTGLPNYTLFSNMTSNISYWKDDWVPQYPRTLNKPLPVILPNQTGYATYKADSLKYIIDSTYNATDYIAIPIKGYVANTDTVAIYWHDVAGFKFEKKFAATDSLATFKPNDFTGYPIYSQASDFIMEINLLNYTPQVSSKKLYYIRLSSYMKYWRTE